ncbi:hypothetical protein GCM10022402_46510 [Salinactinospora qingdaonensis]|uniref:Uncharacterized protein n=1 Tax=Salinactinospora qingdaonensis TaxID=702744 RepID=A0ABP7GEP6_9ACTN
MGVPALADLGEPALLGQRVSAEQLDGDGFVAFGQRHLSQIASGARLVLYGVEQAVSVGLSWGAYEKRGAHQRTLNSV